MKMKAIAKPLALTLTLLASNVASAKYFFEPHAAFIVSGKGDSTGSESYTGPAYGAKFGYYQKEFGFNYGLDFTRSSYSYSNENSTSITFTRNEVGIFGGYNSQNKYRLWAGLYYASVSFDSDASYKGHTFEFGFGYAVAPKVSLNAYYRMPSYTKAKIGGTSSDLEPSQDFSEIVVGVSFPLEM